MMTDYVKYFRYLDNLRESGVTNMFGAGSYLTAAFGLGRRESTEVLSKWMETYDGSDNIDARAAKAEGLKS
jgi:hypothetical protein